jgi:hypothetical protein
LISCIKETTYAESVGEYGAEEELCVVKSVICGYGDKIFRRLSQDGVLLGVGRGKIAEKPSNSLTI